MKLQKTIPFLLFIVMALVLTACAPTGGTPEQPRITPTSAPASGESLVGTRWALVSLGKAGEAAPVIEGSNITIAFRENGQAEGSGGCNSYSGKYSVNDGVLAFEEITSMLMACADAQVGGQEARYLQALGTAGRYTVADDRLSIQYDGDQNVLNFAQTTASSTMATQPPVITDANLMPTGPDEKQYRLTANAGQTITIEITSDGAPLSLTITSPSGIERFPELTQEGSGFRISHTFSATETGEYRLTLTKAAQTPGTNYTATFAVQ